MMMPKGKKIITRLLRLQIVLLTRVQSVCPAGKTICSFVRSSGLSTSAEGPKTDM